MPMTAPRRTARFCAWFLPFMTILQISTSVFAACDTTLSLVDFGRLDLDREANVKGEVSVLCDRPTTFNLALSQGFGDFRLRRMKNGEGSELVYNLFVDPAKSSVWGDGISGGTATLIGENDGRRPTFLTVYAVVPANQSVVTGNYRDNLLVTLEQRQPSS